MKNNQRRNQYRSIRNNSEQSDQKKRGFIEFLKESVALISAGAGIFTVLLYLAGRSFASGYFGAMNIPSYHVSFSIWEYGEVAWLPMLIYPSFIFGGSALIGWVTSSIWEWLTTNVQFLSEWAKNKKSLKESKLKNSQIWLLTLYLSALFLLVIPIISSTLHFVYRWGELAGLTYIAQNANQIDLISEAPFQLTEEETGNNNLFTYKEYFLITMNNGKYYLFKDIDPLTCKPLTVIIIDESKIRQVVLREPNLSIIECHKKLPASFGQVITFVFSK